MKMSASRVAIWVLVTCLSSVNSKFDLDTPISTARCRAFCLHKMQTSTITDLECTESYSCSQGPGCLEACRFHALSPSHVSPVPLEEVLVLNDSRVSWPSSSGPVVYVVMANGSQLCQTLELSATLPLDVDVETVRVLVVDWRGLVKVLGPEAESPIDQAYYILRSLGMEEKLGFLGLDLQQVVGFLPIPKVPHGRGWKLQLETLQQHPPLVLSRISWRRQHQQLTRNNQVTSYLVTWAEDGGVLKGNLITNTSSVTLSLLPDVLYRIQVSTLSQRFSSLKSEPLVLDTHRVYSKYSNTNSSHGSSETYSVVPPQQREGSEGVSAVLPQQQREGSEGMTAVVLLLGIIVLSAWRWHYHYSSPKRKLLDDRLNHTKLPDGRTAYV